MAALIKALAKSIGPKLAIGLALGGGAWAAMQKQFDEHLSLMTGLKIEGRHNFGAIGPGLAPIRFKECCAEVDRRARRLTASHTPTA